ncbi:uncharacterized protein APUU_21970S [Aspergillus puulaauensis]|uniref:Zn(2)-C6 fungal-type domain-containing protein n=1 Tax=Aspergillus puulaauensis TaxID=1220207 RepID=A0A7R7XI35_9EURO|nr:uncharacterized protein APUU_21970S [Aspergillus puulaauensis]BCS21538.1 hypothetical protein APUU_21970S [Aspergillus puulaauensis]
MEVEFATWQQPPSTKQNKGYASKFRLSCDGCSKSKVRCNHERPSCQRCHQAGIRCVYSVSRRTGKPPKSASNNEEEAVQARSISVAVQTETSPSLPSTMPPSTEPTASTNLLHRSSDSTLDGFLNYDMTDVEPLSSHFLSDELGLNNVSNNHDDLNQLVQAHGFSEQMINDELGLWSLDSAVNRVNERPGCHSILPLSEKTAAINDSAPCIQLTSSTLHSLSVPFSFCTTFPSVVAPITIDRVLNTDREAIAALYTLLQCICAQSCSSSMSIALIILKILDSYGAIARPSPSLLPPMSPPSTGTDTSTNTSSNNKKEGGHESIPDSQSASLPPSFAPAGQHMLRRVERVVEAFGRRYGGDVFHGALEQFLRSRVHSVRNELDAILERIAH